MSATGTWKATVESPMGNPEFMLELVELDGGLTGTATSGEDAVPIIDGTVAGEHLRWSMTVNTPMKMTLALDLTRSGDTLVGTAKPKIFPASKVTAHRVS